MKPAIEARGLTQRFGRQLALLDIDLHVAAGERVALLGDNGAGKTTLLRLLATVARPAAGELRLLGLDAVRDLLGRLAAGRTLVFATHDRGLADELDARVVELRAGRVLDRGALQVVR